jgi:hypothetical protein
MADENTIINTAVPLSLHEDSVTPWAAPLTTDGKPHPALVASKAALRILYDGLGLAETAVTTTHAQFATGPVVVDGARIRPSLPEERANQLVTDLNVKLASVARGFDQQLGIVSDAVEGLKKQINTALTNPKRDAVVAQEQSDIRKFVATMPDRNARMSWLHSRIEDGDHAVVTACLASPWAAGLDKECLETLSDLASRKFAPTQRVQLDACTALHGHLLAGSQRFANRWRQITPTPRADSPAVAARKKLVSA